MTYVDPFLGAGAVWLCLLDARIVPLVSWMGGKRRLAPRILDRLGLASGRILLGSRVGEVPPCLLGDASWWGWVWPVCLDPITGPRVAAFLRSWRGEDPRALWFRLRAAGPFADPAEAAAQLLWLQARAASGVPVWWEGSEVLAAPGDGRERQRAYERTPSTPVEVAPPRNGRSSSGLPGSGADDVRGANAKGFHGGPGRLAARAVVAEEWGKRIAEAPAEHRPRLLQEASTQIDEAGQRQATEPKLLASDGRGDPRVTGQRTVREERLIAMTRGGQAPSPYEAGCKGPVLASVGGGDGEVYPAGSKGTDKKGGGGIVDPGTIAGRLDAIRERLPGGVGGFQDTTVLHCDARTLTERYAPEIGRRGRVYLDPPYQGATGYPAVCPRDEVLWIAEEWARHGARVVLSEACGLAAELGSGWVDEQLPSARKPEWITVYDPCTAHRPGV